MAQTIASAYVAIMPSLKGGAAAIQKELDGPLKKSGETGGKSYGGGMAAGVGSMASKIFAPLAAAAVGAGVVTFLKGSIGEASNLNESLNAVNLSYGDAAGGVKALGEKSAKALGLSNSQFNSLAVQFSAFSKTIAGDGGDVTGTLDSITTRASDFASVMNLEVKDAAQLFQSGLAGETEPLRKYGIDLSAAAVEAYGLANGLAANGKSLTESEKVQARYGLLMEQTSKTQGDFANTSDQLANKQRITAAEFANVKARIGTALLPAMSALVGFVGDTLLPGLDRLGAFLTTTIIPAVTSMAGEFKARVMPVLTAFGGYVTGTVIPAVKSFGEWMQQNATWLKAVAVAVGAMVLAFQAYQLVLNVIRIATVAYTGVQAILNAVMSANPVGLIVLAIVGLVAAFVYLWNNVEGFRNFWISAWDLIKGAALAVWNWIKTNWPLLLAIITGPIGLAVLAIVNNWDTIKGAASAAWDWIKSAWSDAGDFFSGIGDSIENAFKNAFNAVGNLWNGTVGKLSWTVPDWIPLIGGRTLSVPNIPQLATGAVVTGPTLAMVGEGREPEAVLPLSKLEAMLNLNRGDKSGLNVTQNITTSDPKAAGIAAARHLAMMGI